MNKKQGLIDTIILIIVALIILGYFNIDLKEVFGNALVKENLVYAWKILLDALGYVWNSIVGLIQQYFPQLGA
jgi:hypothetical protein